MEPQECRIQGCNGVVFPLKGKPDVGVCDQCKRVVRRVKLPSREAEGT